MKKWFLGIFGIQLLLACNSDKSSSNLKIFKYNEAAELTSLDPAFAKDQAIIWVTNQLYNGLVQVDNQLHIQPSIAKHWDISEDGKTYTFHLRNDVFFHDHEVFPNGKGRKVVASDFVYSFSRLIAPTVASPGAWIFNGKIDSIDPFVAVDDSTFQLNLLEAFRPMLGILSMQYCSVLPKEAVTHYLDEFRSNPVGTGPFTFYRWEEGSSLILKRNSNYFETEEMDTLPYLDGVQVSFIESKNIAFLNFLSKELHLISGLDPSYINQALTKYGKLTKGMRTKYVLRKSPYLNTEYLGFNMKGIDSVSPIRNKYIRQAINYGFDREEMIRHLRNNIGTPAHSGFIPEGLPSYDAKKVVGYSYNPDKAAKLLAKAGYPGGEGLPEISLYTNGSYKDFCTFIQSQLADLGIKVKLEVIQPGHLRDLMARNKANFFRGSWIADYPDAESYLAMFYSDYPAPPNYTGFDNSFFDSLYDRALLENNDEKRYALYQQMDKLLIQEAPIVPLYYDEVVRFVQNEVEGLESNPINLLDLKRVRIKN